MCLVIHAEGDLRLEDQDSAGPGPGQRMPQSMAVAKELSICGSLRFHHEFALARRRINDEPRGPVARDTAHPADEPRA